MNMLKIWMRAATPGEQATLATAAETSRGHLYQVSSGNRLFSPGKAALIERATVTLAIGTGGRLPVVWRTDLAPVCAQCEFAQKCLGANAVRAEFPFEGGAK